MRILDAPAEPVVLQNAIPLRPLADGDHRQRQQFHQLRYRRRVLLDRVLQPQRHRHRAAVASRVSAYWAEPRPRAGPPADPTGLRLVDQRYREQSKFLSRLPARNDRAVIRKSGPSSAIARLYA